ncbi:carbohydrate-binding protein [Thraustotheca clavata]|uniref:Carbohydrate-binding protein n=1 Tax=Thraustotheca clavata TaxID=74557 RepID=A0A1V9YUX2_9STRA|nr:carbohydrate-binding protein [Thraustotheca clavata]
MSKGASSGCHWWPLPILIVVVAGASVGITYVTKTGVFSNGSSSSSSSSNSIVNGTVINGNTTVPTTCKTRGSYLSGKSCKSCPSTKNGKTFAIFWESQTDGCLDFLKSDASQYVTHVYWGFAEVGTDGAVSQTFQGNDATLKACIAAMKNKCIKQYASIGGASVRANFLSINSQAAYNKFGSTAASLVQKFGFDGVDIDDESGNAGAKGNWSANAGPNVLGYLGALRKSLDALPLASGEPSYVVSWDELPAAFDDSCTSASADYGRCFVSGILQYVDEVNAMLYNAVSSQMDTWLNTAVPTLWTKAIAKNKLVIGQCVGQSSENSTSSGTCGGYGNPPSPTQLTNAAKAGASYKGAMLWTGSYDWTTNKGGVITSMGKAGEYGTGL